VTPMLETRRVLDVLKVAKCTGLCSAVCVYVLAPGQHEETVHCIRCGLALTRM
jgi:hypothetical protein